jgi:hypothetical protein
LEKGLCDKWYYGRKRAQKAQKSNCRACKFNLQSPKLIGSRFRVHGSKVTTVWIRQDLQDYQDNFVLVSLYPVILLILSENQTLMLLSFLFDQTGRFSGQRLRWILNR